jgi:hypothetical protein
VDASNVNSLKRPAPKKPVRPPEIVKTDSSDSILVAGTEGDFLNQVGHSVYPTEFPAVDIAASEGPSTVAGSANKVFGIESSTAAAYPDSLDSGDFDESMFEGGHEVLPEGEEDFILEPPEDFSQSSIGNLDDEEEAILKGAERESGDGASSLGVQFHHPPASVGYSSYEGSDGVGKREKSGAKSRNGESEVIPVEGREVQQHGSTGDAHVSGEVKKKKKKKRDSKDFSEVGSKKHKSKKKKRRSSSTDVLFNEETVLPEYEFDRGLDRVPMRVPKDTGQQQGTWAGKYASNQFGSRFSQEEPRTSAATAGSSRPPTSASYDNIDVDDDYSPPWLHDGNPTQSQELSFEELDAYADEDEQDEQRVVYKEDVAALVW